MRLELRPGTATPTDDPAPLVPGWLERGAAWSWRMLALAALIGLTGFVAVSLWVAVLPVLLGGLLASLLNPIALWLRRLRVPRAVAGLLSVLLGLSVLVATGVVAGFAVAREMGALTASVEVGYRQLLAFTAGTFDTSAAAIQAYIDSHMQSLQSSAGTVAAQVVNRVPQFLQGLTVAAVTFVFAWYFTWDGDKQFAQLVGVLPARARCHALALGERIWETVGGYMRGVMVVAAADALMLGVGFWIIDMPLILPLMLLMFVCAFVPLVGPVITGAVACLVALGSGGAGQAGLVILVSVVVQQVEGNFLSPFVMGRAVRLHPAIVLFAISAGGVLGGIVGVFLAIPAAASLASCLEYAREQRSLVKAG